MIYLNRKFLHFILGEHLRFSILPVLYGVAAVASIAGGAMGMSASKKQAKAIKRQAAANKKIAYKNAALLESSAERNLKISGNNIRFGKLERGEEQFFLNREKQILALSKQRAVDETQAEIQELSEQGVRQEATLLVSMAASGNDITSVSSQAVMTDMKVAVNKEIAWLAHQGKVAEIDALNQIGLITHNVDRSKALSLYETEVAKEQAVFDNKQTLHEAEIQRMQGDAGITVASAQASAAKAQGVAGLISSVGQAASFAAKAKA